MADNSENKGDASQVNLEEHDRKYHDGAYKGGKCKYRTDHGIPTKPAPEGADMKSTGDGEEAVATKAEKDVDTADKGKKKGKGGEEADRELQRRIADVAKIGRYTDAQGRILLPQKLRSYAKLEKDVVVIGVSNRAEIWNADAWAALEAEELKPENLAAVMEELGF